MALKIVAITGSYRRDGIIESAVEAVLEGARSRGAETSTIRLSDRHIEFCTNCRACTQEAGPRRGACPLDDDLEAVLLEVEGADGLVLGAPVNCFNASAIFRRFLERLVGQAYWPWGAPGPAFRGKALPRKSVLVSSAAMPGLLLPLATGAPRALKLASRMLGARPVGKLWIGLSALQPRQRLSARMIRKAEGLGRKLA